MSGEESPLKYLLAGGFGGICTVISGHPLDTIKIRLQTMPEKYKGTRDAFQQIVTQEGPLSLYKGVSAPLVTVVPMFALSFFGYGLGKKLVAASDQGPLSDMQLLLAGMFSGTCTSLITIPAERIKCLLQSQADGSKRYDGFLDCLIKLWKEGGIRNLYVGTCATLLRDIPATGIYFYSYERILRSLTAQADEVTWQPLVAGGCAGIINWIFALPVDVIKSRLQSSPREKYPRGIRSALPVILKEEGVSALYKGVVPVMLRAFPANAVCFLALETALRFINKYAPWL